MTVLIKLIQYIHFKFDRQINVVVVVNKGFMWVYYVFTIQIHFLILPSFKFVLHTDTHTHTHTHIYTYTHIYIYIYNIFVHQLTL